MNKFYRLRLSETATLVLFPLLCIQWLVLGHLHWNLPTPWAPLLPGIAVFAAAFLLSWAAELAQLDIPQALAIAFVALVAVLPEYAVDMYFAWKAGKDPSYIAYAAANMTGGNRLLIGAGWGCVVLAYWLHSRRRSINLEPSHRLELLALIAATAYSFLLPLKRSISWIDAAFLLTIFGVYMTKAARTHHQEAELEKGPAAWLATLSVGVRRTATLALFLLAGTTIFKSAHPFAEGLLAAGRHWGVEEFLLVQWLAPLASEAPEFIVAILFALRNRPGAGLGTLLSSKVNQWTLLVGMLPIAYGISAGHFQPMHLDARQTEELLLTSAQSLLATLVLCDLNFSLKDGGLLFVLFIGQFFVIHEFGRYIFSGAYILLALGLILTRRHYRNALMATVRGGLANPSPHANS
jgi:cation:H+ antiporter